jgi:hypothetical protein
MPRTQRKKLVFACFALLSGCHPPAEDKEAPTVDEDMNRPATLAIPVGEEEIPTESDLDTLAAPGGPPLTLFLNRRGGTYTAGRNDSAQNSSSIVGNQGLGSATLPPFRGGDAKWAEVTSCLQDQFTRFNVTVTDVEPTNPPYIEAVFGGSGSEIKLRAGGVAPVDTFRCSVLSSAIVFIFTDVLGSSSRVVCEVGAQEIAHALSLDHEFLCEDPMTYLGGCGRKSFQDQTVRCGEFAARDCSCGRKEQNSVQTLLAKLGPKGTPPTPPTPPPSDSEAPKVALGDPQDGATLPPQSTIRLSATATDDQSLATVELLWPFNGRVFSCTGSGAGTFCSKSGNTFTWTLRVGSGDRRFQVRAKDTAGHTTTSPERTVHLAGAPPPPPAGPTLTTISPPDGTSVGRGDLFAVRVNATDPDGIAKVSLTYTHPGGTQTFPLASLGGGDFGLNLRVQSSAPLGARTLEFVATDNKGQSTTTRPFDINVTN